VALSPKPPTLQSSLVRAIRKNLRTVLTDGCHPLGLREVDMGVILGASQSWVSNVITGKRVDRSYASQAGCLAIATLVALHASGVPGWRRLRDELLSAPRRCAQQGL
jgi:hypothetical protein